MRALLLLPLLLALLAPIQKPASPVQNPAITDEGSPIVVLTSKWAKSRLTVEQADSASVPPAPAMISANKIVERNRRADIPAGGRDPNLDTVDGRSAALEKSVQDSRAPKPIEGFVYRVKVHNADTKLIDSCFGSINSSTNQTQSGSFFAPSSLSRTKTRMLKRLVRLVQAT